jgi:signal transduction histidine kinase/DNA-binding NarL/FixJ family response regulator
MHARLILATAPVIILLWVGIGLYLVQKHRADLDGAAQESRNLSRAFEENIRRTVETIDTTIRTLRTARAHDPAHFDIVAWERDSGLTRDLTLQISLADRTGTVIATNLGLTTTPVSIADRAHFRLARDQAGDALLISRPVVGRVSRQWSVQFVRSLFDAAGGFDGAVVASLDPAFLSRFYTSLDHGSGALLLAGQDGFLRAVAPGSVAHLDTDLSATELMQDGAAAAQGTMEMAATADAIDRIYSWRRVDPYGMIVAVGLSRADVLAEYRSNLRGCVAIGLGLTVVTLLVGMVLARNRRDLLRSREILLAAVDNISQGLMVIEPERDVSVLNARAVELLELPEELTKPGFAFGDLLTWQVEQGEFDGPEAEPVRALALAGGIERGTSVYQRTRRDGTVLEIRTKVLDSGLAVRTYTDITEQQHTAQVLADARDAAEAAMRARSEFLAVMSHEIRTPLNGVIGVAGLLEDMDLGPAQLEYVRLIRQSGDHLLVLVNDILDFSRLEAERVQLEEVDFDPMALVQGVVGMFMLQAGTKGLHLSAIVAEAMPAMVVGDPGRLRQVLLNLVGNAVKFTDHGWISLTLAHEPQEVGRVRLLFSVADSGVGIIPEAVERMFQEFTQMDGSISRRFGGSGLGLAICRRLVELMGGSITVESRPGAGSTFRFDVTLRLADRKVADLGAANSAAAFAAADLGAAALAAANRGAADLGAAALAAANRGAANPTAANPASAAASAADAAPGAVPHTTPGLRILLAEDNPTNRLVALRTLERLGHRTDVVGTGAEAVAALALVRYDLILMDVMMPDMDGLTATRHIRTTEPEQTRIVIVGLTAGSSEENLAACLDAGMDAVTTKPITLARLRSAIAEGLAASGRHAGAEGPEPTTPRLRELAEMLGDDAVAEIVQAFTEDTGAHLTAMRAAAARGDSNALYRFAHSVAGAARNVGADALAERASALEETVGSLDPARIATEIAAMQQDLDAALQALAGGRHCQDGRRSVAHARRLGPPRNDSLASEGMASEGMASEGLASDGRPAA